MSLRRILALTAVTIAASLALIGAPAGALDNPDYTSPPPTTVVATPPPAKKQVTTAVRVAPVRTRLAITGSDVTLAVIGGSVLALGVGTLAVRRRAMSAAS